MQVTVIICKHCGRHATKQMQWKEVNPNGTITTEATEQKGLEKHLYCLCGQKEWVFRLEDSSTVQPEYLVMNG